MRTSAYFEEGGRQDTPVWTLDQLAPGHRVRGPALLIDDISTIVVEPSCEAEVWVGHQHCWGFAFADRCRTLEDLYCRTNAPHIA